MDTKMKAVYDIIVALRNTSGKNAKLAILQKNANNAELKEFLRVTYEPRINFYQSKVDKKAVTTHKRDGKFHASMISAMIAKLHDRAVTGGKAKQWLADVWFACEHDWERELIEMLIDRDVKAGFAVNTINTVWADLVTDVPYMRCSLPEGSKLKEFKWKDGVFSQVKADGMFANVERGYDNTIVIMSRNGSPFPIDAFPEIVADLMLVSGGGFQLHGELLVTKDGAVLPRQESNGIMNKLLKGGDLPSGHRVIYKTWDIVPIEEAVAGGRYAAPYFDRFETLCSMFPERGNGAVTRIETKRVCSPKEAKEHYIACLEQGLEGTVLKDPYAPWEDKTSKWQVKYKVEVTVDLKVVGFKPGRNKFEGLIGSLECESSDGLLSVNVSGFPDDLRKEMTENFESDWLGGIVAVTANGVMPPRKGIWSLFLPRFSERRYDKKKADSLKEIQAQFAAAAESL
jgi:DNA ligase-1